MNPAEIIITSIDKYITVIKKLLYLTKQLSK